MSLLQLNNIFKTYSQGGLDVPALSDINLSIEEGEYVAIMGPSGSGKSTLMNIIGCLDKPTKGSYILGDEDISVLNDRKLSDIRNKEIGFVFQQFNLMPRQSALQNVELPLQYAHVPRKDRRPMCEQALIKVGLEDRMSFKATQLSGGQKQRVAIARAIVNKPRILLADEPTGALDSKSGIQVMQLFKQLHDEGSTIIMITHAQEIADHANRIIKIFDGEITSDKPNTPVAIQVIKPDDNSDGSEAENSSDVKTGVKAGVQKSDVQNDVKADRQSELNADTKVAPTATDHVDSISEKVIPGPQPIPGFKPVTRPDSDTTSINIAGPQAMEGFQISTATSFDSAIKVESPGQMENPGQMESPVQMESSARTEGSIDEEDVKPDIISRFQNIKAENTDEDLDDEVDYDMEESADEIAEATEAVTAANIEVDIEPEVKTDKQVDKEDDIELYDSDNEIEISSEDDYDTQGVI